MPGPVTATPRIAPPPPLVERRTTLRRAADREAEQEALLLARALDVLAEERPAEDRLAGLLDLLARTVGAERAAVLADGEERRIAVATGAVEAPNEALALAAWLDANAPRTRVARAAASPAPVAVVVAGGRSRRRARRPLRNPHYALVPIDRVGDAALGFAFRGPRLARRGVTKLPSTLARHAAVALALVTAQVADERELGALRGQEEQRRRFVSTVAHDLRTPLSALGGYLDLILDGRVDDPGVEREFLARGRAMVEGLATLVGDLLELSRLEAGTINLEIAPFSGAEAGQRVVEGLLPIALERRTRLSGAFPSRLRTVVADRRRVDQVLTNLVSNAVKFTPRGGSVEVELTYDGPVARYVVRDDGRGIDPEDRTRIFDRFFRAPVHEQVVGTGLGLSIGRELARAMGGDLDVASVVGRGSAFVLVLPGLAAAGREAVEAALVRALVAEETVLQARVPGGRTVGTAPPGPPILDLPAGARAGDAPALQPSGRLLRVLHARRVHIVDGALAFAE